MGAQASGRSNAQRSLRDKGMSAKGIRIRVTSRQGPIRVSKPKRAQRGSWKKTKHSTNAPIIPSKKEATQKAIGSGKAWRTRLSQKAPASVSNATWLKTHACAINVTPSRWRKIVLPTSNTPHASLSERVVIAERGGG